MRNEDECPVCDGKVGRVEEAIKNGEKVLRYWHTDLEHTKEYCLEYPDGSGEQICQGQRGPTGPRKA